MSTVWVASPGVCVCGGSVCWGLSVGNGKYSDYGDVRGEVLKYYGVFSEVS